MDTASLVALFAAIGTIWVAVMQIKATNKVSQDAIRSQQEMTRLNLTMQLIEKYDCDTIRLKRQELAKKLVINDTNSDCIIESVADIFETVGALHQRGWLDQGLVYNAFSVPAIRWWYGLKTHITNYRNESSNKEYYDKFEYLANLYLKQEQLNSSMSSDLERKEFNDFLKSEID